MALLFACSGQSAPTRAATEHWTGSLTPAETGDVVAEVNGAKIYAADVARQMAARGQTAREAVGELIDAELLAAEALRRGLADDPEVAAARDRERVRAMLRHDFEPSFDGPEDIPVAEVDSMYNNRSIHRIFEHPEIRRVAWVRANVAKNAPAAADAQAHQVAADFWTAAKAAHPADAKAFFELAKGRKLDAKRDQIFPAALDGGTDMVFAKAAFAIPAVGELSPPTRTQWGWDVQLLLEIIPERHATRAEADAEIRSHTFDMARKNGYQRWVEKLVSGHRVVTHPELLDKVQVDSLVGL